MNMFSKANALWSQGKEKVQKAYEEKVNADPNHDDAAETEWSPTMDARGSGRR
jgi:hypothetical protein